MSSFVSAVTVAPGPAPLAAIASGSYSVGPDDNPLPLVELFVTLITSFAPMDATVSSMYRLIPVPSPLVTVRVNAPTKMARIVNTVRVLERNVFEMAEVIRSAVLMRAPPRPRSGRP